MMKPGLRRAVLLLATVAAVGLTARLGFWQLDRAAQKLALQAAIEAQQQRPALSAEELAVAPAEAALQVHRQVRLRGQWLHEHTVFLDNRTMNGRVGFFVLTPLQLQGRPQALLVQRGWVPRDALERSRVPALSRPAGPVELRGRLALAPSSLYQFDGASEGVIRQNLTAADFAAEIGRPLLPLTVLQLEPTLPPETDVLLRAWPAPDFGLHKHYGYAFQWFALCALLLGLYVWFQTIRPRLQARRHSERPAG